MNSPNLTTVLIPSPRGAYFGRTGGRSIGRIRADQALGECTRRLGTASPGIVQLLLFTVATRARRVGGPLDLVTDMGPLISRERVEVVKGLRAKRHIEKWAKLALGGAELKQGSYLGTDHGRVCCEHDAHCASR